MLITLEQLSESWGKDKSVVRKWLKREGFLNRRTMQVHHSSGYQRTYCFNEEQVQQINARRRERGFIDAPDGTPKPKKMSRGTYFLWLHGIPDLNVQD